MTEEVRVRIDWAHQTIDIIGWKYTEQNPYWFEFSRVDEPWVNHMAQKSWMTDAALVQLAKALEVVRGNWRTNHV